MPFLVMNQHSLIYAILSFNLLFSGTGADTPVWRWECLEGHCQKRRVTPDTEATALGLSACQITCLKDGPLWPRPTGQLKIGQDLSHIAKNILVKTLDQTLSSSLIRIAANNFKKRVDLLIKKEIIDSDRKTLIVTVNTADGNKTQLTLDTDESYSLEVSKMTDGNINATIMAQTFFGARHGLETLSQLIIYDDIKEQLQMPNQIYITDKPVYPYRGVLLDTARNYLSVASIKRTIDGLAASKLNTLHWHITDVNSFAYVSKSLPELSRLGAYSIDKVYSPSDVKDIVQYGRERGIRILPELNGPAHVGEGWQDTDFVTCFQQQPWQDYCQAPPCGQFDPTKPKLYDALESLYKDIVEQFNPDIFHMGGDEVSMKCWNMSRNIIEWMDKTKSWGRSEQDFVKLWNEFQSKALERFDKQSGRNLPIILFSSTLTTKNYVERYLSKDRYIIQVWTKANDWQIKDLLQRGYKLILSNHDGMYLDCGFAGWVQGGNNWCTPYVGWQKMYENSPAKIGGSRKDQFLGGEAALWSEQVDDTSLDSRIWPRAAAMAERLWAEPTTKWRDAEPRMLIHRQRLIRMGIKADALEPEWCMHYDENCPTDGKFNVK